MNRVLPQTPADVRRQVELYQYVKTKLPRLYEPLVQQAEQRPDGAR